VEHFAAAARDKDGPNHKYFFANLGHALVVCYFNFGRSSDLDDAIKAFGQAISRTPRDSPDLPGLLNNLAVCLRHRHNTAGAQKDDLEESVKNLKLAVDLDSSDSLMKLSRLHNLLAFTIEPVYPWQALTENQKNDFRQTLLKIDSSAANSYLIDFHSQLAADWDFLERHPYRPAPHKALASRRHLHLTNVFRHQTQRFLNTPKDSSCPFDDQKLIADYIDYEAWLVNAY